MQRALTKADVDRIQEEGYNFDLGKVLEKGWALFSPNLGMAMGAGILFTMITVVSYFTIVGPLLLIPCLLAGFVLVAHHTHLGNNVTFSTFFSGFEQFGQLVVAMLIQLAFQLLAAIPYLVLYYIYFFEPLTQLGALEPGEFPEAPILGGEVFLYMFLSYIPILVVSFLYSMTFVFVSAGKMKAWDAMEASRKLVAKKIGWFILFGIIIYIMNVIGMFMLLVGALITFPLTFFMMYAVYLQMTKGLEEEEGDGMDIAEHLVE